MSAKFVIRGGRALSGRVACSGSKNSALPIITAAALASSGEVVLDNVPQYSDIYDLCQILKDLGAEIEFVGPTTLRVRAANLSGHVAPYQLARKLRGSTYVAGLLLGRLGRAEVACPGGCAIGSRPIDFHLKGFQALGAEVGVERGCIVGQAGSAGRLKGARFYIDRASFGTTVNMMIAAVLAEGTTVLENAAREPEIVDLATFMNSMGAQVRGAGTNTIRIEGVPELKGASHEIIPDRLEAGTYLMAAGITGGEITVDQCIPEHLHTVLVKLQEAGMEITEGFDSIHLKAHRPIQSVDIETQPHPGFATDLQSPFLALMTLGNGISVINETIFENRFSVANELMRMGANIKVDRNTGIVRGVERLTGAPVEATDLRGGAALVVAGLAAEGITEVNNVIWIDRGYYRLEESLGRLGAEISREGAAPLLGED